MLRSFIGSLKRRILFGLAGTILAWAGGTSLGLIIAEFSVDVITSPFSRYSTGFSLLLAIGVFGMTASGLFVRRLPMAIAAGITAWPVFYGISGLFGLFVLYDIAPIAEVEDTSFWTVATTLVIQVLTLFFLRLPKFLYRVRNSDSAKH
jgi:hypothetical protein